MKIDEAKIKIGELACYARTKGWDDEYTEAVNMAIEALDQEHCDDAISRQAVLDVIEREEFKGDAISEIEKLPPVTPQPKVGRWKRIKKEKYVQHAMSYYRCSECGKEMIGTHNYCPNCGCKMQEGNAE